MIAFLDHLAALFTVGALLLSLLASQRDGQAATRTATAQSSGRPMLTQTASWMERDLDNLGAGVAAGTAAVTQYAWSATGGTIVFLTTPDTTAAATVKTVRYDVVATTTRNGVPLYEVRRTVVGGTEGVVRSPATVRAFQLTLYNGAGGTITSASGTLADVRSVGVRLVMDPPLGGSAEPLTWARRFYPVNLTAAATAS
jgi:hypothetical protein